MISVKKKLIYFSLITASKTVKVNRILHQAILHQGILLRLHHQLILRTTTSIGHLQLFIFMHRVIQVLIIYKLYPLSYLCHNLIIIGSNKSNGSSDVSSRVMNTSVSVRLVHYLHKVHKLN